MKSRGERNVEIQLAAPVKSRGPMGGEVRYYIPYATVWAGFDTLSGKERLAAQQVGATLSHEVTIDYDPETTVTPEDQILLGDRTFDIKGVRNVDEGNKELRIRCTEVLA